MDPKTETFDAELAELAASDTPVTPAPAAADGAPIEGRLGRFVLLEVLGRGGMGVVYSAYDPELDRKVALKLVRRERDTDTAQEGMVREARGLARITHPNVVTVHEVGVLAGRVFVVMELLAGKTLRAWVADDEPDTDAIVDAYAQAGRGLAAAHAAGLVHRDFKPSNAIRGDDGRVRVIDFGLVAAGDENHQRIAGTPRYMAPEQAAGAAASAAADQYSLCVALAEAVDGRSLPRHVDAAIARGRAERPADRFASVDQLVAELERRPGQTWRRVAIAVAMLAVTGGAMTYSATRGERAASCDGGEPAMAALWNADAEGAARATVAAADWPLIGPRVDEYARSWASLHRRACLDHDRGEQSDNLYDRRVQCLERRRRELGRTVELLADPGADAVRAVASLSPVADCDDTERLLARTPLPRDPATRDAVRALHQRIDHNRASENAGLFAVAMAEAADIARDAAATGFDPLIAEAKLQHGRAAIGANERSRAAAPLHEAMLAAVRAGEDELAIEALARYVFAAGSIDAYASAAELQRDGELGLALLARAPEPAALRALLENNIGTAHLARGERELASQRFEAALVALEGAPGDVELAVVPANLALTIDDGERRERLLARAVRDLTRELGPDNARTLAVRRVAADHELSAERARHSLTQVVDSYRRRYPGQSVARAWVAYDLAQLEADAGRRAVAAELMDDAAASFTRGNHANRGHLARSYASLWRGQLDTATAEATRVLEALAASSDRWWNQWDRADAHLGLGLAELARGRARAARPVLEAAVASYRELAAAQTSAVHDRNLARAQLALADALPSGETDARRALLDEAAAWYRRAGNTHALGQIAARR